MQHSQFFEFTGDLQCIIEKKDVRHGHFFILTWGPLPHPIREVPDPATYSIALVRKTSLFLFSGLMLLGQLRPPVSIFSSTKCEYVIENMYCFLFHNVNHSGLQALK